MQKDCQTVCRHPSWSDKRLSDIAAAWYQREITIPEHWAGRRIVLSVEYLNSYATVYVDGKSAGDLRFPGGELDLSPFCDPGSHCLLTLHVAALPLKGVLLSYTDTNSAREVPGRVARRGLCGDVYLMSMPPGPRIADVKIETSVRNREIAFDVRHGGPAGRCGVLAAGARSPGDEDIAKFQSQPFRASDLQGGHTSSAILDAGAVVGSSYAPQNLRSFCFLVR